MATKNSTGNIITFTANGDTARTTQNVRVGTIVVCGTSLTAAGQVQLMDYASAAYLIPLCKFKSGTGIVATVHMGKEAAGRVLGLKATYCSNATISVYLE